MLRTIPLFALLIVTLTLAGCGNKGPLVPAPPKPAAPGAATTVKPTTIAAPAASTTAPLSPFNNHNVQ
ncbi:putative small lipoprotein YifL [Luteibacter sp. Sphag1AF]|uniref:LPS translocon maturation chaperone LptM n=1 Tax=Luteibacter sp. Sphag1AF TaxID=2587031 RepID=UPI0016225ECC|nr:lipoprotein [Luteibacter sp. Sphag1AF]MBB3226648.1 putative small lipoprotein YifL [Luteibacter sp. Sphag1AF]